MLLFGENSQKFVIFIIFVFISCCLFAQEPEAPGIDLLHYYSFTPKILEDGTQNDFTFGSFYNAKTEMQEQKFSGEVRGRTIKTSGMGEIWDITDSMLTSENETYEVFFLPGNYQFLSLSNFSLRAGIGAYYNFNKAYRKGYFNDKSLYEDPLKPDHYNAYVYDFKGHAVGPILDLDISFKWKFLNLSFSGGVVPIYYFYQDTSLKLSPLMTPSEFSVSGGETSGPYYYLNLDLAVNFFDYVTLFVTLFNEYSNLKYNSITFDEAGAWTSLAVTDEYRTLALEISLLINLKGGLFSQLGYGRTFDEENGGKNYFILGVKKLGI